MLNLRRWFLYICTLILSTASAGCQEPTPNNIDILTNRGKGKYWDLVYSTTALGTINESVLRTRYHERLTTNVLCDYYAEGGKLTHYRYIDSVTVVDAGASDIIVNPDNYTWIEDSLRMGGFSYKILVLTPDILALRREWQGGEILRIYVPSHLLNKRVK